KHGVVNSSFLKEPWRNCEKKVTTNNLLNKQFAFFAICTENAKRHTTQAGENPSQLFCARRTDRNAPHTADTFFVVRIHRDGVNRPDRTFFSVEAAFHTVRRGIWCHAWNCHCLQTGFVLRVWTTGCNFARNRVFRQGCNCCNRSETGFTGDIHQLRQSIVISAVSVYADEDCSGQLPTYGA
ncbi:MAG: hypothetical protein LUC60_08275, partial [Lachnospiraceae bacterium]|nr:hypothetical protein [Lachnospiraceae bacterium]